MADAWKDTIKDVGKGVEYLGKRKKGQMPQIEKMEEAIEGPQIPPAPPPEKEKELLKRSTSGSPPFSEAELKKGYRKL